MLVEKVVAAGNSLRETDAVCFAKRSEPRRVAENFKYENSAWINTLNISIRGAEKF